MNMTTARALNIFLGLVLLPLLLVVSGCDYFVQDQEEEASLVGQYEAQTFTAEIGDLPPVDLRALGGTFDLTLREDQTLEGELSAPGELASLVTPNPPGEELVAQFSGTYTVSGDQVTFDEIEVTNVEPEDVAPEDVDTSFIEDLTWIFDEQEGTLSTETNVGEQAQLTIVLQKR